MLNNNEIDNMILRAGISELDIKEFSSEEEKMIIKRVFINLKDYNYKKFELEFLVWNLFQKSLERKYKIKELKTLAQSNDTDEDWMKYYSAKDACEKDLEKKILIFTKNTTTQT